MATTITLKAMGLNTNPNQLDLPEGSLSDATNVIIRKDNVLEPIRGFALFGESFGNISSRVDTLWEYRGRIIRQYFDTIEFQNGTLNDGTANFDAFSGSFPPAQAGLRTKITNSGGNQYFTSAEGIKKISAKDGSQLNSGPGFITNAGGIKAVDFTAKLNVVDGDQSSFLPQDSAVAYRIVWATKDANNVLIQGTPSQREEVYNPLSQLIVRDLNRTLLALDYVGTAAESLISDTDYVSSFSLPITATSSEILNNLESLATKVDQDLLYANQTGTGAPLTIDAASSKVITAGVYTINFSAGDATQYFSPADKVYLSGFDSIDSTLPLNGVQTIATVSSTSITMNVTAPDSVAEVQTITTVADVASSLNNKYFTIDSIGTSGFYVWFNVGGAGVDPGPIGSRAAVPVGIAVNASNTTVGTSIASALNGITGLPFSVTSSNGVVTVTNTKAGVIGPAVDTGATTFQFAVVTTGKDGAVLSSANLTSGTFRAITEPDAPDLPTPDQELVAIQSYLGTIITDLQLLKDTGTPPALSATSRTAYIDPLDLTTTASVKLDITIPTEVTPNYFFQVYRSSITLATGVSTIDDIVPDDELQLVYEAYPTALELAAHHVEITDVTPDEFRGANLYTNAGSGEGILQANDTPPFALDISRFKNVVFYANTRTRHLLTMSLLGVQGMIDDFNNGTQPSITIISGSSVNTYNFVTGLPEITDITTLPASALALTGPGSYFLINSGEDSTAYYVWYQTGTNTDPAVTGKTGIMVVVNPADSDVDVANTTNNVLSAYTYDFLSGITSPGVVTVIAQKVGYTTASSAGTSGFTVVENQTGRGESVANKQILLSTQASVGLAVDETARSLIRVVNGNTAEVVNGYYTSSANDVPGKFYLEAKTLDPNPFYLVANNDTTGSSFNPDIGPTFKITSITTGFTPVITTALAHGVSNNEQVLIALTNSTPKIDGLYAAKYISPTQFSIEVSAPVTVAGTSGVGYDQDNNVVSQNDDRSNRIFYSKKDQPEAVPTVNFFDVGDSNKAVLRIFPLRDSLFVYKEDGLYRVSGEVTPFTLALFDSSVQISAPDSLAAVNNVLYCLTSQGITSTTEGGSDNSITIPLEQELKEIVVIPNYKTICFGVGYEADESYTIFMPTKSSDVNAKFGYRYSTRTKSWTKVIKDITCGFINDLDGKEYFGCGDVNFIEQERKNFNRTDYAARQYPFTLSDGRIAGKVIRLDNVDQVSLGDVFLQSQNLTVYEFNMLLRKLDLDPGLASDYFSTLSSVAGDDLRLKLVALASKLDANLGTSQYSAAIASISGTISSISVANPTVITSGSATTLKTGRAVSITGSNSTPSIDGIFPIIVTSPTIFSVPVNVTVSGTSGSFTTQVNSFSDIAGCFDIIVSLLNSDDGVSFSNYVGVTTVTDQEAIVISVNKNRKEVTLNLALDFVPGPLTLYKAISTNVTWCPNLLGDPVNYKHLREATIMFTSKAFTNAVMSFATDLLPEMIPVPFNGDGNGIFGHSNFGTGFFGGASNAAPFRTYIPRQCQRCRFIVMNFQHMVARESYAINGVTLTGENTQSTRAYRG